MGDERNIALVLSGGGINGTLLETGFLQGLREHDDLWRRVGWIFGTSAGALAGSMATIDRLDDMEEFLLGLRPEESFRPNRLWQTPFTGLHDYALPETIAERLGPPRDLMAALTEAPIELVVSVTDVGESDQIDPEHAYERTFSSRTSEPEVMGNAILASAAISALVLPRHVDGTIGTDGGWVRNFPLGHAYDNPAVSEIVGFRYMARYPRSTGDNLARFRKRLDPFRAVPPVRALIGELAAAEERRERGEPAHLPDMILRLMRVAISRNTALEERFAGEKDESMREFDALRKDIIELVGRQAAPWRRRAARRAAEERFAASRFPFRHDRLLPCLIIRGEPGEHALDPGFRAGLEWPLEAKRGLLRRGRAYAEQVLRER